MATTQNTYTGNGSTTNYSFTFEYLKQADVKVTLDTVATTAFTFANATTLSFTTAPANGVAIRIFRDTAIDTLSSTFFAGSAIKAEDLNQNFTQSLYVTQESETAVDISDTTANAAKATAEGAVTTANSAVTTANSAVTTANSAETTANTASTNATNAVNTANTASTNATTAINTANSAVTTANTASTNASAAVTTANTASTNASAAVTTANTASTTAASAVTTANTASTDATTAINTANAATTTANGAVTTANSAAADATTAINTANGAVTTANAADATATAASAAVSNAVLFTLIANVAAIPGSPSNNDYIEIGNSTGIESFSPLSGLPSGFVGASGLTVRLRYDSSASSWVFMNYFANDSETRYLTKNIPVVTGDATNGSGQITLNCEVNTHGVKIKGPPHSAAANYTLILPNDAGTNGQLLTTNGSGTLTWTTQATDSITEGNTSAEVIDTGSDGRFVVTTEGSEALRVDSSGRLLIGTASARTNFYGSLSSNLQIEGSGFAASSVYATNGNGAFILGRGNPISGSNVGNISWQVDDGLSLKETGSISCVVDGTPGNNDTPGRLVFSTTADGASSPTERLRIDSSGNVGIGTSSPSGRLHVNGSANDESRISITTPTNTLTRIGYFGLARFGVDMQNGFQIRDANSSYATRFLIDSSGNVGIGTSAPSELLEIKGVNPQFVINGTSTTDAGIEIQNNGTKFAEIKLNTSAQILDIAHPEASGQISFSTGASGTERLRITSGGYVGIGTSSPSVPLDVVSNSVAFGVHLRNRSNDDYGFLAFRSHNGSEDLAQIGVHRTGANVANLLIYTSGSERMRIASAGQIGLGGANYGTSGQVITSNGSGSAPTWQSVPTPTVASQAEAEAGTDNTKMMTPLRVAQAIAAQGGSVIQSIQRGTTAFNNNTVNVSITSVNTSKSFVSSSSRGTILTASGSNSRFAASGSATSQLTSSTNVQVVAGVPLTAAAYQYGGLANSGTVTWEVIEFK